MEIIDLTYPIVHGMSHFAAPWHTDIFVEQMGTIECVGRETRKITLGTHSGTHMDAPLHFIPKGNSIDKIPLDRLIGDVTIIRLTNLPEDTCISRQMIEPFPLSRRIIFFTGRGQRWNTNAYYHGYPYLSLDAAQYLVDNGVDLIGLDTPSPDDSRTRIGNPAINADEDSPAHKFFLSHGVILVEYLANLESLKDYNGWKLIVMPLKIAGADGSPVRACLFRE
jgi:arylformamidase